MQLARGLKGDYHDHQLVVADSDLLLVEHQLNELKIGFHVAERHSALRLKLLELDTTSMGQAVQGLMAGSDPQIAPGLTAYNSDTAAARQAAALPAQVPDLELLLKGLRLSFAAQYPNWEGPQIGKNRAIDNLAGAPEIGPGGVGDPTPSPAGLPARPRTAGAGRRVRIAQLDGLMCTHPWLYGRYVAGPRDQVPPAAAHPANQGHAASVASCILSIAPYAELRLERVLGSTGMGDAWTLAKKMADIADSGYDVVNVSVGQCFTDDGNPPLVLDTAVRLLSARSIVIAAAGNHGNVQPNTCPDMPGLTPDSVNYPAGCYGVIAVGALDQNGHSADFTPKSAPYIRLMAPGTGITAAYLDGEVTMQHHCQHTIKKCTFHGWAQVQGTSYSAAIVTGEIARRTKPGKVTPQEALDQLLTASAPITVPNPQGGFIRPYSLSDG